MKFISLFFIYIRFLWIVTVKVKSTTNEEKIAEYYKLADELEKRMYLLVK